MKGIASSRRETDWWRVVDLHVATLLAYRSRAAAIPLRAAGCTGNRCGGDGYHGSCRRQQRCMRLNLIRIVALPNLQFLTFILIPALPSHRTMSPGQRKKVLPARSLRHSRKWYTTPPPSTGQATDTAVGVNEIGRLTTSFATNDATPSPPKVATRMWYSCPRTC